GAFEAETTDYAVTAPHGTTHVRLAPTAAEPGTTMRTGAGSNLEAVRSGETGPAVALEAGENTLIVAAVAQSGAQKTYTVTVTLPTNDAPAVASAIADATIVNESGTHGVSLSGVFRDADGDALTVTASSSDENMATVSVSADYSTLTATARNHGTATVTVTASDGNGGSVEDSFTVKVKAAPVVASPIADVSELEVEATQDVSLSEVFSDADGDALTITAASSDDGKVTVAVAADHSKLTVAGVAEGTATITVTARDADGNSVSDAFGVSVAGPANNAPTVSAAVADATIVNESGAHEASLSGVFADGDGDDLTVTASSSNENVVTVSVASDYSTLTVSAQARGTATVTGPAEDGKGGSVEDSFTVKVKAAPTVATAIADVSGLEAEDSRTISMSGVFSDPDGDAVTVTEASSSDTSIAAMSAAIDGATAAITAVTVIANSEGTATITVTAQDSDGNTVQDAFDVTVNAPAPEQQQQKAVELPGPVLALELTAAAESVTVNWSAPESGVYRKATSCTCARRAAVRAAAGRRRPGRTRRR
ncbi:MAG: Ig-like domain-containing protein, partial [Chloroflexi bacterium]|nr:Ig-like domain-containing protein [Chloroflexota bacterium]